MPKRLGNRQWGYSESLPPTYFAYRSMCFAMMCTTERHREFVADLLSKCQGLSKPQMVWIRRLSSADQTRLRPHQLEVLLVAATSRLKNWQHDRFVRALGIVRSFLSCFRNCLICI